MTTALNQTVFRMYWGPMNARPGVIVVSLPKDESGLRTILTTLVKQLYDREYVTCASASNTNFLI